MKLRWREATHDEEENYPCTDFGRRWPEVPSNFILEQLCDDGIWQPVEIDYNAQPEEKTKE